MMRRFKVVDLFAGPGGLAEGFSRFRDDDDRAPFEICLSVEKEASAFRTLRLRSFVRQFGDDIPDDYYRFVANEIPYMDLVDAYPREWSAACQETLQLELGTKGANAIIDPMLDAISGVTAGNAILIGGPPCQAYSLVGRARNQGKEGYIASEDSRHFLYQEYIRILDRLRPAAFVMENVKGMLSSSVDGESRIFEQVLRDLQGDRPGADPYRLIALAPRPRRQGAFAQLCPSGSDFILRAEDFGVPQARHRVIVVGIRADLAGKLPERLLKAPLAAQKPRATVGHVLGGMPKLRSGLSRGLDSAARWQEVIEAAMTFVADVDTGLSDGLQSAFAARVKACLSALRSGGQVFGRDAMGCGMSADCPADLRHWLSDSRLKTLPNHASRGHMPSDLARYFFAAVFAEVVGRSPKAVDFPKELAPDHDNWHSGKFADRFRVQLNNSPSTTVTSHISKDGHYFIHPDPMQCRSLSVREAARLQTFPDNYVFLGNRTEQYVQVGNAVPPLLASVIASGLFALLNTN